jgi:hypothetical protein
MWDMFFVRQGRRRPYLSYELTVLMQTEKQISSLRWNCSGASSN